MPRYNLAKALGDLYPNVSWECYDAMVYENIRWLDSTQPIPPKEELEAYVQQLNEKEPMRLLREERNKRLKECDWVTMRAYSEGTQVPPEWLAYMKALRDLPSTITTPPRLGERGKLDLTSVNWPIPPTSSTSST